MKHRSILHMGVKERLIAILNFNSKSLSILDELLLELDFMENTRLHLILFTNEENLFIPDYGDERLKIDVSSIKNFESELSAHKNKIDTVVILADRQKENFGDQYTILLSRKISKINPDIHVIVELNNSTSVKHLGLTTVDDVVCIEELSEKLLSNSSITHGFSKLFMHLLYNNSTTNSIFSIEVPEYLLGETYKYAERLLSEFRQDMILIGLTTKTKSNQDFIIINPSRGKFRCEDGKQYCFIPGDNLIVIAYENPEIGVNKKRNTKAA